MSDPTVTAPHPDDRSQGVPTVRAVHIEVVAGPDAGKIMRTATERVVVGTHASADLVLSDRTVSRFHVELALEADAIVVRDLRSKNRTLIGGVEIEIVRLRSPTMIAIGMTDLRIDLLDERVELGVARERGFGGLVGVSPAMRAVFAQLAEAARHQRHTLIEGEPGTGKHVAASHLHELGARSELPFDVIDCADAPAHVDAQLFGSGGHPGALVRCHGGTLVLDEIGALPVSVQRRLARALEDRVVRRVDGASAAFDVRVIALSRRNLRVEVNREHFLPELFDLIAGTRIRLPPLRQRPEDIAPLVDSFVRELHATGTAAAADLLANDTLEQLRTSPWLGNVRELRAYVEQAISSRAAAPEDAPSPPLVDASIPLRELRRRWIDYFEHAYVAELLARTGGKITAAAQLAGVDRVYMHRLVTRTGLRDQLKGVREG